MSSKQVLDDQKVSDSLIEAARTNAAEIGRRRAARFAELGLKGAPGAEAIAAVVLADAHALEVLQRRLVAADQELAKELSDDAAPLAERDASAADVRALLVDFRNGAQAICGDVAVRAMGFVGDTPRDPVALLALAEAVMTSVAKAPPRATRKGVKYDAHAAIEELPALHKTLKKANAAVLREKREEQTARAARDEAWAAFDQAHKLTYASLDAALRAAGMTDIADRLRASERAAAKTAPTPDPDAPTQ